MDDGEKGRGEGKEGDMGEPKKKKRKDQNAGTKKIKQKTVKKTKNANRRTQRSQDQTKDQTRNQNWKEHPVKNAKIWAGAH